MMRRILLAAVLALAATGSAQAGPVRGFLGRVFHHGSGCGAGCNSVQSQPVQQVPATGQTVHLTSYTRVGDGGPVPAAQYQPIRLGYVLPTCAGGSCPR